MTTTTSILQHELGQQVPFASAAQEAVIGLLRTASLLQRRFAAVVEPHGITFQQYNVLRILRGAGEPLPTMTISRRMIEQTPGITRLLDRLEKKGLIMRERHQEDRRQVLCTVTAAGLRIVDALDEPINQLDEMSLAMLSEEDQHQLIALLDAIRQGQP